MTNPKFLYHYTSVNVLCNLFTKVQDGHFVFHASSVYSMNDNTEYYGSINQCSDGVEEIVMERELGIPFALCSSEDGESIPMWNMYANNGKGVCLRFNYEKINDYINGFKKVDQRPMLFSKCIYVGEIINKEQKPLDLGNKYLNTTKLSEKMKNGAFLKPNCFSYEKEWRLMIWQDWVPNCYHIILFKERHDELCPFIEIPIPVNCLDGIILPPNSNEHMIEATKLICANYGVGNSFNIDMAKMSLKV